MSAENFGGFHQADWTAEEEQKIAALKAEMQNEDDVRIRMTALAAAAEVARGTLSVDGPPVGYVATGVVQMADVFDQWIRTGQVI
jgi:hypothetical protein